MYDVTREELVAAVEAEERAVIATRCQLPHQVEPRELRKF